MTDSKTVNELLGLTAQFFSDKGIDSARLEAEVLLAHVLSMDRLNLYLNLDRPLMKNEVDRYRDLVRTRGNRTPLSYILGYKEFYSKHFLVNPSVLIPRPETELLVEKAYSLAKIFSQPRILDLGCGSGVIAITLASLLPDSHVTAVDVSQGALEVARENARQLGQEKIQFVWGDLFSQVDSSYHVICSNPPYIPSKKLPHLQEEVLQEPVLALDGGYDGLFFYRRILEDARHYLTSPGYLLFEMDEDLKEGISSYGTGLCFELVETLKDYAKRDRVMVFRWNTKQSF